MRRIILMTVTVLAVLEGVATLLYGGGTDECTAAKIKGTAFVQRAEGERFISTFELDRIKNMNQSLMCEGNCMKVAERISDYLNTGNLDRLKLPGFFDRLRFKETFFYADDDGAYWANQAAKADKLSIRVYQPGSLEGALDALNEGGPGSHGIVFGTLKSTAKVSPVSEALTDAYIRFSGGGHAFNLAAVEGESGTEIIVLDGYSQGKFDKVIKYSSAKDYFDENYDYDMGMIFFPPGQ
ncbi:phosphoenolpyruvate carboxykinase (ATP) [Desulfogranum mediterraneum]|uniref:hypothetical protein n=1 Tax=Desulfogranum mediterraneum TaxID=160661 RepID=UPI00048C1EEC|nr:hypothetical protein [Desulfogranum mediterraneum]